MSDPDNTNTPRPPQLPEQCPWPPEFPDQYPARPEGDDPESPYNEEFAREAFGDRVVGDLIRRNTRDFSTHFRGDWWQLAFLTQQGELDKERLFNGEELSEKERFSDWNRWSSRYSVKIPIHLEGACLNQTHLENACLSRVHLENAKLFRADLKNADLSHAHLENASLRLAHLENADLYDAHLENADLRLAHLENAGLRLAHLKNSGLSDAHLENTDLSYARLENANLSDAHLENARLSFAILNGVDVRWCRGLKFDLNQVDRLLIEGKAPDPWSELRRKYSGPLFMVHLLLLVAFLLPYAGHLMILTAESRSYSQLEQYLEAQDEMPEQVEPASPIEKVKTAVQQPGQSFHAAIGRYKRKFEQTHTKTKAFWPLFGWTRTDVWGRCYFFITIVILIYNGLRGYLTYNVSILRDAEERSRITPALKEYYNEKHSWYRLKKLAVQLWDKYNWQGLLTIAVSLLLACHIGFIFGNSLLICFGHSFLICLGVIIIFLAFGLKKIRVETVFSFFRKLRNLLPGLYQWHLVARVLFWIAIVSLGFRVICWMKETSVWVAN
jgi:uncharacterized protein YjbI with pentapeptide repeats